MKNIIVTMLALVLLFGGCSKKRNNQPSAGDERAPESAVQVEVEQEVANIINKVQQNPASIKIAKEELANLWSKDLHREWRPDNSQDGPSNLLAALAQGGGVSYNKDVSQASGIFAGNDDLRARSISFSVSCVSLFLREAEVSGAAQSFPDVVSPYIDGQIKEGDILIYQIVDSAALLFEHRPNLNEVEVKKWVEMANAENPIYRLMAVNLFSRFNATPEQANHFYSCFDEEHDAAILGLIASRIRPHEKIVAALSPDLKQRLSSASR